MRVTIEGYIARDNDGDVWFHEKEPKRYHEDFITYWQSGGFKCKLPEKFSRLLLISWSDNPRKVEFTIGEEI